MTEAQGAPETTAFWRVPPQPGISWPGAVVDRWVQVELGQSSVQAVFGLRQSLRVTLPEVRSTTGEEIMSARRRDGSRVSLAARAADGIQLAFDPDRSVRALVVRNSFTGRPPWYARLPLDYKRVPPLVRVKVRNLLGSRADPDVFPRWPLDLSAEVIRNVYRVAHLALDGPPPLAFWPDGKRAAIALTFDVDSARGQQTSQGLADDLVSFGLAGCFFVVGKDYPIDTAFWRGVKSKGSELGLHGVKHDHRLPFAPLDEIRRRLDSCMDLVHELEMQGFRAPSFLRTPQLLREVGKRFSYDSSVPHSHLIPSSGNGCATFFPFRLEGVTELPVTLPPDGLMLSRGQRPEQILAMWLEHIQVIRAVGGIAVFLAHPETGFSDDPEMRKITRSLYRWLSEQEDLYVHVPSGLVSQWNARQDRARNPQ